MDQCVEDAKVFKALSDPKRLASGNYEVVRSALLLYKTGCCFLSTA